MTDCIFCKIVEGSLPSTKIYEDDYVYAFMDIMPLTKGHVILIPKTHLETIYDFSSEDASRLFSVVPQIANALKAELKPAGMNLLQNNGAPAGQSVFHFHMHFIPRYDETDGFDLSTWNHKQAEFDSEKLVALAETIKKQL